MTLMTLLARTTRAFAPTIATEWLGYAGRFRRLGLPARWAANAQRKHDLANGKIELLPSEIRRAPGVVLDVGANVGNWSAAVLRTLPVERLLAFEPNPSVAAAARTAIAPFPVAEVHAVGLGAERGLLDLRVEGSHDLASFLPLRGAVKGTYSVVGDVQKVAVPVHRLDDYTGSFDRIGLLKLDVQGFESQVLAGAADTLEKTACILVEVNYVTHYEGGSSFDEIHRLLADRGFCPRAISAPWMSADGVPMWADAVYVRGER